jgi:hypothetical protein
MSSRDTRDGSADVLVYGGTAAGVTAAVAASDAGQQVVLVEPGQHVGGMVSGGLSHTDWGQREVIGGLARSFYEAVARHYDVELWGVRGPEPHVAEEIFREWLAERSVELVFGHRVERVQKDGRSIVGFTSQGDRTFRAASFVDASYEGDLLARAGVSYDVGRESRDKYGERYAGRRPIRPDNHNFHVAVSPTDPSGELSPLVHDRSLAQIGEGDGGVMSYCYRLCVTDREDNRRPWTEPENYDREEYLIVLRLIEALGDDVGADYFGGFRTGLPNDKGDANSGGAISLNLLDGSAWEYPDAGYDRRDELRQHHLEYTKGLLWFLAQDEAVPERIRDEMAEWGLCEDEFRDTDGWPHQLYVREARRMKGEYVLTEQDLFETVQKYDSVGMGSYNIDIREVQRVAQPVSRFPERELETFNEGYLSVPVDEYQIPYRSLVPRWEECDNLLVPVCLSASHVAFASVRMEPQYMLLGHAAGQAAAQVCESGRPVQRIDVQQLQSKLRERGQTLTREAES